MSDISITLRIPSTGLASGIGGTDRITNNGLGNNGPYGAQRSGGTPGPTSTPGLENLSKSLLQDVGESALGNGISPTQDGGGHISENPLSKLLLSLIAMLMENQKNQHIQPQADTGSTAPVRGANSGAAPSVSHNAGSSMALSTTANAPSAASGDTTAAIPSSGAGKSGPVSFPTADNANAIVVNKPIYVGPGEIFDGKGKTYVAGPALGDGGQKEGQKPLFEVADGGSVKNVIFGNNAADGIHLHGDAKIDNVHWTNVGEDALTVKSNTGKPANVSITNSSAQGAADKVFQLNADAKFSVNNFKVKDFGTFVRTNGGQQGNWNINLSNIDAQNGKFSFVKSDSEGLKVNVNNASLDNVNNHYKVPKSTTLQIH
ncbi:pectate lyase [Dickeya oryzae]|uniref:pectate lyase n=1 Tax=Dickeya oryzae TaxID=1240404 RepID=UPI003160DB18